MAIDPMLDWERTETPPPKPEKETRQSPAQKIEQAIAAINDASSTNARNDAYQNAFPIIKKHLNHVTYDHLSNLVTSHFGEEEEHTPLLTLVLNKVCENDDQIHQNDHHMLKLFAEHGKRHSIATLLKTTEWPQNAVNGSLTLAANNQMVDTTKKILETQHDFDISLLADLYDKSDESAIYKPIRVHIKMLISEMADKDPETYRAKRANPVNKYMTEMFQEAESNLKEEWQMASSYEIGHKSEVFGQTITSIFNFKSNKVHIASVAQSHADFKTYDFKDYENQNEIETAYHKMQLLGPEKIPEYHPATAIKTRLTLKKRDNTR